MRSSASVGKIIEWPKHRIIWLRWLRFTLPAALLSATGESRQVGQDLLSWLNTKKKLGRPSHITPTSYTVPKFVLEPPGWLFIIMGTGKKESNRLIRQGKTGDGLGNVKVKGENFYRYDLTKRSNLCPEYVANWI